MNAIEYKQIMEKHNRTESFTSVMELEEAKVVMKNIKIVKKWNAYSRAVMAYYGIDIFGLIDELYEKKNEYIKRAIKYSWKKEEVDENDTKTQTLMEMLKRVYVPKETEMIKQYPIGYMIESRQPIFDRNEEKRL